MTNHINRIWNLVGEVVEENLDLFLEDEDEEDYVSNFKQLIVEDSSDDADDQADDEENFCEANTHKYGHNAFANDYEDEFVKKDRNYWLNEFDSMIEDHMPVGVAAAAVQAEKTSNSRLPLILGGGGILLLGLVTSTTVLIRLKKGKRFRALPVMEEEPVEVEVEVTPVVPEPKKRHQAAFVPGPFFMLHRIARNLMPRPVSGGMHE